MAIKYFGEDRMKQLLGLIKGQLDLKATPAQIAQAITDANLGQYALDTDLDAAVARIGVNEGDIATIKETLKSVATTEGLESLTNDVNAIKADYLKAADKAALQTKIDNEATARADADTALGNRVTAIEDDYLKAADKTELQTAITNAVKAHDESDAAHAALFKAMNDKMGTPDTGKTVVGMVNEAAAAAAAAQSDVDALEGKVGTVPADKTVVEMISDAQTAATYDDTQVKADIKANADAIGVLNGAGEGSVDKKITDAFNDFATKVTDDGVVNSYKELIDWAATHGAEAAEMAAAITALENILNGIGGVDEPATVVAYVSAAIDALKIGDYAKAADLTALATRVTTAEGKITTLEGKAHEHANKAELDKVVTGDVAKWNAAEQNAKDYADDLNEAMDTRVQAVEGAKHTHSNKAVLDSITQEMVNAWNTADTEYTEAEVTAMWNEVFGA